MITFFRTKKYVINLEIVINYFGLYNFTFINI